MSTRTDTMTTFITPEDLLEHWQGHQRLTRRVIEAFPEDQLFSFAPAVPMRSFGGMVFELIRMVEPTLDGFLSEEWGTPDWSGIERQVFSKAELLDTWSATGQLLREQWPRIQVERFHAVEAAFGLPPQPNWNLVLYLIDNEVHHRAQGYVYLRLLNIEPPAFYER